MPDHRLTRAPWKPTRAQLEAARDTTIHDVLGPNLRVVFCGINPSLYSGAVGRHFARPGNRFWPVLHRAGFTPRQLAPFEDDLLLNYGCGVTNIVARTTARADELSPQEFREGGKTLAAKVRQYQPAYVAVVGVTAFRHAFEQPKAKMGLQPDFLEGARVWVLPNPSGLNAHYTIAKMAKLYRQLHDAAFA